MSYQDLEKVIARPKLTISKLQRFRKEHLEHFCEVNSIDVQQKGVKKPTKAAYTTALLNAVLRPTAAEKKANRVLSRKYYKQISGRALTFLWQKMTKKPKSSSPATSEGDSAMDIDGEYAGCPTTPLTTEDTKLLNISEDIGLTRTQLSLAVPDNASPPKLRTAATTQSVNIDSSGLRIRIPVLKRKREKEGLIDEPQAKRPRMKRKGNKRSTTAGAGKERHLESDEKDSVLVRAYSRRGDDTHISEAEIKRDSTGGLAVEHVAEALKLKGIPRLIYPRNRYLCDLSSQVNVSQEEIEELQDANGILMLTFNQDFSKRVRPKRHVIEFLYDFESTANKTVEI